MEDSSRLTSMESPICPLPLRHDEKIVLGHGSGGKMMTDLIQKTFIPQIGNPILNAGNDAGLVYSDHEIQLAISTDSHVVFPLFFPGGDIGKLAVCGTVNDVAMMGAVPKYITAGFILEEGLDFAVLERVVTSMKVAAEEAGVEIVAGDTKVVEKGKADGLYINTAGVGFVKPGVLIRGDQAKPGDIVIVSGPIGDHGIAVLEARGNLGFEAEVQSDIAPLNRLVASMLEASNHIHVMRDPTRGGIASALNEIAKQSKVSIHLEEDLIPVRGPVQAACEILGFDPLYVANEGKLLAFVEEEDARDLLTAMRSEQYGEEAAIIGHVHKSQASSVLMKTALGSTRVVDVLAGEMLPRIC